MIEILEASGKTLASLAIEALRRDILDATLIPGAKLRVEELRQRYGFGATPLREALSQLAAEGLVERLDQRGFRVAGADAEELRDLVETRCLIEPSALRASIERGDAAWEERLVIAHHRLARAARSLAADRFVPNPEWDALHCSFHMALLEGCGARTLLDICEALHLRAARFRNLSNVVAYPQRDVAREHEAIFAATLARRAKEAVDLLIGHYRQTERFVASALNARESTIEVS